MPQTDEHTRHQLRQRSKRYRGNGSWRAARSLRTQLPFPVGPCLTVSKSGARGLQDAPGSGSFLAIFQTPSPGRCRSLRQVSTPERRAQGLKEPRKQASFCCSSAQEAEQPENRPASCFSQPPASTVQTFNMEARLRTNCAGYCAALWNHMEQNACRLVRNARMPTFL